MALALTTVLETSTLLTNSPQVRLTHDTKKYWKQSHKAAPKPLKRSLSYEKDCKKNPGHLDFFPILAFCKENLPWEFRTDDWTNFIKVKGHETVKVSINYTSPDRSDDLGFAEMKGTNKERHGSGTAFLMDMEKQQPCPIQNCPVAKGHHMVSGYFKVITAYHVVYNDEEAKHTTLSFFYDDEEDMSRVVTAHGVRLSSKDEYRNRAVVDCVTHDLSLCAKLQGYRREREDLLSRIQANASGNRKIVVMISHPHGQAKHVTVGKETVMVRDSNPRMVAGNMVVHCQLAYTTPTCPGSGGGSVNVLCSRRGCIGFAPHCACGEKKHEGVSGLGWVLHEQ